MSSAKRSKDQGIPNDPLINLNTPRIPLGLTPLTECRYFTITTDSYISLCSRVHAALCAAYENFLVKIPESVFQYYAVILLWKRIAQVVPDPVKKEWSFLSELPRTSGNYVPQPLETYLKGIGNYNDPDGCNRNFTLPRFPNKDKELNFLHTFGRVDKNTHVFYESFPAPGISGLRILADIRFTKNPSDENLNWDLPDSLRPSVEDLIVENCDGSDGSKVSVKPTRNLLGWAQAQRLSDEQSEQLKLWKIDETSFLEPPSGLTTHVPGVFNKITETITKIIGSADGYERLKLSRIMSNMGSITQGVSVEKQFRSFEFQRSALYCEGDLRVCSPYKLNDGLTQAAAIAGYRMAKEPIIDRHCWSCYDFDGYKSVPESWIASRNNIHAFGCVGKLNEPIYTTAHADKRMMQNDCISHTMFSNTDEWDIYM